MIYLFGDYMSQPSRAIFALANIEKEKIGKFEIKEISLGKLE